MTIAIGSGSLQASIGCWMSQGLGRGWHVIVRDVDAHRNHLSWVERIHAAVLIVGAATFVAGRMLFRS
jgi:hypothetical protein